jgi:hydrogenase maturation protease
MSDAGRPARTILLGLGSPIRTDDAVGPAVARAVHARLKDTSVDLHEAAAGGIELVEMLAGYRKAVIVDAIKTDGGRPGDCRRLDLGSGPSTSRVGATHELGLVEGIELGRRLGMDMPDDVIVYAVEVLDPWTFGERLSPAVAAAVPAAAAKILSEAFGVTA